MRSSQSAAPCDLARFRRPAETVMRLARLGCSHPTRLSFLRTLLRRVEAERWCFTRASWDVDATGVGRAVYRVSGPERSYSLVAFSHDLPPEQRSDRVIATAWDATFTLFDGVPGAADLDRLAANVPLQEAGRISSRELTLSRANRSVRLFEHVVSRLATGQQPELAEIDAVGYLMRTTAVYGSGKFGAADRAGISERPELSAPFQAEMLTVWLIRAFTVDIAEHMATMRGGATAVPLDRAVRRRLGVGNSTGLGMAPFIVRHPVLLNNWIAAREDALARVRAQPTTDERSRSRFIETLQEARLNADFWLSDHAVQKHRLADLRADLAALDRFVELSWSIDIAYPWNALWQWGEQSLSLEGQEALVALMLEVHGDLVDDLASHMSAEESATFSIAGQQRLSDFKRDFMENFRWALDMDMTSRDAEAKFWYVSAEKLEPRLGYRETEEGASRELPLASAPACHAMQRDLDGWRGDDTVAAFLAACPEHRLMVRRAQIAARYPYSEVQDNLVDAGMLPIDLLRCKLAFFGASRFDPRSDLWVRINLFQGLPFPDELATGNGRDTENAGALSSLTRYSRSEIESLAAKATRGAGFSWGVADDVGVAIRQLVEGGLAGPEALFAYLTAREATQDRAGRDEPLCPISAGIDLLDRAALFAAGGDAGSFARSITHPLIVVGFAMRAALMARTPLRVTWNEAEVDIDEAGRVVVGRGSAKHEHAYADVDAHATALDVTGIGLDAADSAVGIETGRSLSDEVWNGLGAFSMRTVVPATESSRHNAGAGATDND